MVSRRASGTAGLSVQARRETKTSCRFELRDPRREVQWFKYHMQSNKYDSQMRMVLIQLNGVINRINGNCACCDVSANIVRDGYAVTDAYINQGTIKAICKTFWQSAKY